MWLTMCVRILSNSSIVKLKVEMVVTTCLVMPTISFWQNVLTEKNPTCGRFELMSSHIPSLLWSTAPLCRFCNWIQQLIIYPALGIFCRDNFLTSHDNVYCCEGEGGRVHSVQYIQTSQLTLESRFLTHYFKLK
jgi:hypothetical protein